MVNLQERLHALLYNVLNALLNVLELLFSINLSYAFYDYFPPSNLGPASYS
jgi:hypothetical protein